MNRMQRMFALAGLLSSGWLPSTVDSVLAQQPPASAEVAVPKIFTRSTTFRLPVGLDERYRATLKELRLHVKQPPNGWVAHEAAPPTQTAFSFTAPGDGEYWFGFVMVDQAGRAIPSNLDAQPPGKIVVVDTRPPEIEVRKLPVVTGKIMLQVTLRDANPDYARIRVEAADGPNWKLIEPVPDSPGIFLPSDESMWTGPVRVSAADRAGNQTVREFHLATGECKPVASEPPTAVETPASSQPPVPAPSPAPAAPPAPAPTPAPAATPTPVATLPEPSQPPAPSSPPTVSEPQPRSISEKLFLAPESPAPSSTSGSSTNIQASRRCVLDYALENGVEIGKIEVYATRDGGRSWQRIGEDTNRKSPVEFDLPAEDGVYGITLSVARSGAACEPPKSGDAPDWTLELDTTRPLVRLLHVRKEATSVEIAWEASDKNLLPGVTLAYAVHASGPWQVAAKGLPSSGRYLWTPSSDVPPQVYLRIEAVDRAGNRGVAESAQPTILREVKPKVRVIGVKPG